MKPNEFIMAFIYNQSKVFGVLLVVLFLTLLQLSYADTNGHTQAVDLTESYTVNVPNSQGGYTAIFIKKFGDGYIGPRGEHYSGFPTVAQLQAIYGTGVLSQPEQPASVSDTDTSNNNIASVDMPKVQAGVNDFAGVISQEYRDKLTKSIRELEQKTLAEIMVVTVRSTAPLDATEYAKQLLDSWKPVGKDKNNAVFVFLAVKQDLFDIEPGDSLKSILSEKVLGEIMNGVEFKPGNFSGRLVYCVDKIINILHSSQEQAVLNAASNQPGVIQATPPSQLATSIINRVFWSFFILFYLFVALLGVLKAAEKKAVFFKNYNDYKKTLIIGLIFLFITLFLSLKVPSDPKFVYAVIFILIFSFGNVFVAFYINRDLKFIPLVIGLSRSIVVFFMPLMQAIDFVCMRVTSQIMKRIDGENGQKMFERLGSSPSLVVQISSGIQHFLGLSFLFNMDGQGILLNRILVELEKGISSDSLKFAQDFVKKNKESQEEPDKAINQGAGFDGAKKDIDEDLNQKTDYDSNMGGDFNQEKDDNPNEEGSAKSSTDDQQSPYDVLGVSEKASLDEIKAAYRNMAMKNHPDRTAGLDEKIRKFAEEEMKKINRAYEEIMKSRGQK